MKKPFLWIAVILLIFIIIAGGFFLYSWFTDGLLRKPEIVLLQPTTPQVIELSQGLQLIVQARSKNGIRQIDFLENGVFKSQTYSPNPESEDILSQFSWLPDRTGVFTLEFTAFDHNNVPSKPASITVGVISPGLSENDVETIENNVTESVPINVASGSPSTNAIGNEVENGESDPGEGDGGVQEEDAGDDQIDGGPQDDRPDVSDLPPEIMSFDTTSVERRGDSADINFLVIAQDDFGIEGIFNGAKRGGVEGLDSFFELPCENNTQCEKTANFQLEAGEYVLFSYAFDSIGQVSNFALKRINISENPQVNEGPAIFEEEGAEEVGFGILNGFLEENGFLLGIHPFSELAWIDLESPEEDEFDCQPDCPPTTIQDARIEIGQSWQSDNYPELALRGFFPPNLQTEVADPLFGVIVEEKHQSYPVNWCRFTMTPEIESNGFTCENIIQMDAQIHHYCGEEKLTFRPAVSNQRVEIVERGVALEIEPYLCPPPKVELIQLEATNSCPGGSEDCIIISWNVLSDGYNHQPIDHFKLVEKEYEWYGINEQEIVISPNEVDYLRNRTLKNRMYEYFLFAVSPEGIESGPSKMNIRTPRPIDDPHRVSNDWQDPR